MDAGRFDAIARVMGSSRSRRGVVAAIAGLLAGKSIGGVAAAPRKTCRRDGASCTRASQCCSGTCPTGRAVPRHLRNRCAGCGAGEIRCNGSCVDISNDLLNCGGCGQEYACVSSETLCCNGECLEPNDDNCSACGAPCGPGQGCLDGTCCGIDGGSCNSDGDCCPYFGAACVSGFCRFDA
jgi:hypothetical protein